MKKLLTILMLMCSIVVWGQDAETGSMKTSLKSVVRKKDSNSSSSSKKHKRIDSMYYYGAYYLADRRNAQLIKNSAKTEDYGIKKSAIEFEQIGNAYAEGKDGYVKNTQEAIKWYKKGAELGEIKSADCASSLGMLYETINTDEAVFWYVKALDLLQTHPSGDELNDALVEETAKEGLQGLGLSYDPKKANLTAQYKNYEAFRMANGGTSTGTQQASTFSYDPTQLADFQYVCKNIDKMLERKEYKNAVKAYSKLIKRHPREVCMQAFYGRALAYYNLHKWKKAIEDLRTTMNMTVNSEKEIYDHCDKLIDYARTKKEEQSERRSMMWAAALSGVANAAANGYAYSQGMPSAYIPTYNNPILKNYSAASSFNSNYYTPTMPTMNQGISFKNYAENIWMNPPKAYIPDMSEMIQQAQNQLRPMDEYLKKQFESMMENAWSIPADVNPETMGTGGVSTQQEEFINSSGSTNSNQNNTNVTPKSPCSYCHGAGRVLHEETIPTYGLDVPDKYCSECGKHYKGSYAHYHIRCPVCRGNK